MRLKIGRYTWNSKKCIPLQVIKYGLFAVGSYIMMLIMYFVLLPYSTMA